MKITARSDTAATAGILTFGLTGLTLIEPGAVLTVEIDGRADLSTKLTAVADRPTEFHVHTHLLEDGPHTLTVRAKRRFISSEQASIEFNVENRSPLAKQVSRLLAKNGTSAIFSGPCDSSLYPYDDENAAAWFDRPDAQAHIDRLLAAGDVTQTEADALRRFVTDGFMVLEGLLDDELVDAVNLEIDDAIERRYQNYEYGTSQRIEHLHLHYPNMRKLWLDRRHLRFADLVYSGRARPCQTLTYVFGSQQDAHQDTVHLTPFPAGYMCGTWIALQDISENSGELIVYPGSHREPRIYLRGPGCEKVQSDWSDFGGKVVPRFVEMAGRYAPFIYRPKKGTVLIWHENLLHAGSVRLDKSLPRRSVVIHTFADGAIGYYDSTGMAGSAVPFAELAPTC
jgi:hypothetical protein